MTFVLSVSMYLWRNRCETRVTCRKKRQINVASLKLNQTNERRLKNEALVWCKRSWERWIGVKCQRCQRRTTLLPVISWNVWSLRMFPIPTHCYMYTVTFHQHIFQGFPVYSHCVSFRFCHCRAALQLVFDIPSLNFDVAGSQTNSLVPCVLVSKD